MTEKITFDIHAGQSQMIAEMARMRAEAGATVLLPMPNALTGAAQPSFGSMLNQAINHVDNLQHAMEAGQSDDCAAAMLESQKVSIAFPLLTQIHDKLSTAFDDVINTAL